MVHFRLLTFVGVLLVILLNYTNGQTIKIDSVSKTEMCRGDNFIVYYSASGTFEQNNVFTVQISYPYGDFSKFNNIGNIQSTASGQIKCVIPAEFNPNVKYKIRIMSTLPYLLGSEFSTNIGIYVLPDAEVSVSSTSVFQYKDVIFTNNSKYGTYAYWEFGEGASKDKTWSWDPIPINYSTTGQKIINVWITSKGGCSTKTGKVVNVFDCKPKIDSNSKVVDIPVYSKNSWDGNVWICSQGLLSTDCFYDGNIYMETGATAYLHLVEGYPVIYMKAGSSINIEMSLSHFPEHAITIIYEEGASINIENKEYKIHLLKCDNLIFDYTVAPVKGKIAQKISVNENNFNSQIAIYPNPSEGILNISLNSIEPTITVSVVNVLGNEIYTKEIENNDGSLNGKIDLSSNPPGLYFLKIFYIDKIIIEKIILK